MLSNLTHCIRLVRNGFGVLLAKCLKSLTSYCSQVYNYKNWIYSGLDIEYYVIFKSNGLSLI